MKEAFDNEPERLPTPVHAGFTMELAPSQFYLPLLNMLSDDPVYQCTSMVYGLQCTSAPQWFMAVYRD
jgi:hypothetical protein